MVEYVLLLGFIVVAAMAVMTGLESQISGIWSTITSALSSAVSNCRVLSSNRRPFLFIPLQILAFAERFYRHIANHHAIQA